MGIPSGSHCGGESRKPLRRFGGCIIVKSEMESRQPLRHLCYMFLWAWWCITFKIAFLSFWSYWPIHIITEVYSVTSRFFSSDLIGATPGYGSYTDGWNVMFFFTGSLLSTFNTQEGCNATLLCNQSGNVTWLNSIGQKIEGKHKPSKICSSPPARTDSTTVQSKPVITDPEEGTESVRINGG